LSACNDKAEYGLERRQELTGQFSVERRRASS
jgi:hypothetical protein